MSAAVLHLKGVSAFAGTAYECCLPKLVRLDFHMRTRLDTFLLAELACTDWLAACASADSQRKNTVSVFQP